MSPFDTLKMWPKVRAGEEKWIYPFRKNADVEFDTALPYELAILKLYVDGLLVKLQLKYPDNVFVDNLIGLLAMIHPASANIVPGDSILRETIGGSQLDY